MRTHFEIGARVTIEARAMYPKTDDDLLGTVIGELFSGLLVINLGPTFAGHNGHGFELARGAADGSRNLCYVHPDYVGELPDPIAPARPKHTNQQHDCIVEHLLSGKSITQREAFGV